MERTHLGLTADRKPVLSPRERGAAPLHGYPHIMDSTSHSPETFELSIVLPCLNEADTLAACLLKAQCVLREHGIAGEIIVADNGSTDGSREIAARMGARVVNVPMRGYGAALMGGIGASQGRYIIMGDADDSYDFGQIPAFLEQLRAGYDLVQGCRLPAGGGTVLPGAMPPLHRWIGNPVFSMLARVMFSAPIHDVNCGMRGFTRALYESLEQRATGMEFAVEMIVKACAYRARIAEVPITLHPDGRRAHAPHLRMVRDGWRTLRLLLMCSPRWLYNVPGLILVGLGLLAYGIALPGSRIAGVSFDVHTLLVASLAVLLGYQSMLFGVFAGTFAAIEGFLPAGAWLHRFLKHASLERGLVVGLIGTMLGLALIGVVVEQWWASGFGNLNYETTMRWVIPGATLTALGFQTVLASFMISLIALGPTGQERLTAGRSR
jgi:glycosyltransferase involved in cell wall biosynthesis